MCLRRGHLPCTWLPVCLCVRVCMRACVCVCVRESERERVCVRECVCAHARGKEWEQEHNVPNCQPLLTDKPRQRGGRSYMQSHVIHWASVHVGGVGVGGRFRMLNGHVYAGHLRICVWSSCLSLSGKVAFVPRRSHVRIALPCSPSSLPFGAWRPHSTCPVWQPLVIPPRLSTVMQHQRSQQSASVSQGCRLVEPGLYDTRLSILSLCQLQYWMCSYPYVAFVKSRICDCRSSWGEGGCSRV